MQGEEEEEQNEGSDALTPVEKEAQEEQKSRKRFQLFSILIVDKVSDLLRDEWRRLYNDNLSTLKIESPHQDWGATWDNLRGEEVLDFELDRDNLDMKWAEVSFLPYKRYRFDVVNKKLLRKDGSNYTKRQGAMRLIEKQFAEVRGGELSNWDITLLAAMFNFSDTANVDDSKFI